jgi:hypothetical protein
MKRRMFDRLQTLKVGILSLDTLIRYLSGQLTCSIEKVPRIDSYQQSIYVVVEWSLATACAQSNFEKNPALLETELAVLPDSAIASK